MALDNTAFASGLKTLYPEEAIKNMIYRSNPLYALIPKMEDFVGDSSKEPITIGNPQNRSASFSGANSINTSSVIKSFFVTRVSNYSMAAIANETMLASESDKGAFLKAVKFEIDNALNSLTRAISTQLYRSGTGTVAKLSASANVSSTSVYVQLATPSDIVNLEVGMSLAFSGTDGGAVRSGTAFVVSIDRSTGSFLCSGSVSGAVAAINSLITSIAASDFVYAAAGDRNAVVSGLQAWLPGSAVTSTTFFGVDRTIDKTRLAGITYDGSASSIEEALIDGAGLVAREGGSPDHAFVSFEDFRKLVKAVGSKQQFVQYTDVRVDEPHVSVGFNALQIAGPHGIIKVVPDQNCPAGKAFLLQLDTWALKSLGAAVRLFEGDGMKLIRDASSDALLVRCFSYANLSCRAPGWNAVVTLP